MKNYVFMKSMNAYLLTAISGLLLSIGSTFQAYSQGVHKLFQDNGFDHSIAHEIIQTIDNSFILIGVGSNNDTPASSEILFLKTNLSGARIKYVTIAGIGYQARVAATESLNGSSILVVGTQGNNIVLVNLDLDGNELWREIHDAGNTVEVSGIIQASNGELVFSGTINTATNGMDAFIAKTNNQGKLFSLVKHGGSGDDRGENLIEATLGNFVLVGQTKSYGPDLTNYDAFLTVVNGNLNTATNPTTQGPFINSYEVVPGVDEKVVAIVPTADGGWVLAGQAGVGVGIIGKVNAAGTPQWVTQCTTSNKNNVITDLTTTEEGGYAMIGRQEIPNNGNTNFTPDWNLLLLKVNGQGQNPEYITFGSAPFNESGAAIMKATDGKLAVVGQVSPTAFTTTDLYFIKYSGNLVRNPSFEGNPPAGRPGTVGEAIENYNSNY